MDLFGFIQHHLGFALLVMARISGVFIAAPVFGSRNLPSYTKIGLALSLTYIVAPVVARPASLPDQIFSYSFLVMGEVIVGLVIGFAASLVFSAVQMAGQLLDMQIGFGIINIFDPQLGQQLPLIGNFKYILALIVFLSTNGHHILLTALVQSFKLVPLTGIVLSGASTEVMVDMISGMFTIAIKISLPVLSAILLTDVALGILARTMPQMNIFVVGVPGKILVGLFVFSLSLPLYVLFLEVAFNGMFHQIYRLLATFA